MNFKFKHTDKITGVFILLAIVILVAGAVFIGISRKLFIKTYRFKTVLSDAAGLSTSTPLSFKGYKIGRVKRFVLNTDNNIDVELAVYREFRERIVPGAAIYRLNNPITGETSLVLLLPKHPLAGPGSEASLPLPEDSSLPSLDMEEGQKLVEDNIIEKSGDTVALMFDEARVFVSNLRTEFKLKKDIFKTFFENIHGVSESLARNQVFFDHLNQLLDPDKGPVFSTMNRFAEISKRLEAAVDQLNEIMGNYKKPEGLMVKMLQLNQGELNQAVENLNRNLVALGDLLKSLKENSPLIAELLDKSRKTLQAINNNPLLRGGIEPERKDTNSSKKKRIDIDE
jgi:phospholipid/cholesterol/gamma-HCH transport system substrate-binding protein